MSRGIYAVVMARSVERVRVERRRAGAAPEVVEDALAAEEPLEIRVGGRAIAVTMRTPGHDEELAMGFLVGEGVVRGAAEVERVRRCPEATGDVVDVLVNVPVDFAGLTRHVFASSSCGVCGAATIDAVRRRFPRVAPGPIVAERTIYGLIETLRTRQPGFDATGGLHAAGLFDATGVLLAAREDVGRHNAVDKVVGWAAGRLPLAGCVLAVSGRASFEIVQKAAAAGVPVVAAVSAPSSLAVELAAECGVTLIGFLREGRFNVYAGAERIGPPGASPSGVPSDA